MNRCLIWLNLDLIARLCRSLKNDARVFFCIATTYVYGVPPPVTIIFWPVVNDEREDARNRTALATSTADACRRMGVSSAIFLRNPSATWATKSVSTKLGTTRFAWMFLDANSIDRLRVS